METLKNGELFDYWLACASNGQYHIKAELLTIFERFVDSPHKERKAIYEAHPEAFEGSVDVLQIIH